MDKNATAKTNSGENAKHSQNRRRRATKFNFLGNCCNRGVRRIYGQKCHSKNQFRGECEAFSESSLPGDDFLYLEYSIKSFHLKINVR